MSFVFVIPVYNEEEQVADLVAKLMPFLLTQGKSAVWIIDNGSDDETWKRIEEQKFKYPDRVFGLHLSEKGQGLAFRSAMQSLSASRFAKGNWIVFSAADLPFGFGDLNHILEKKIDADLVIGSKAHPDSVSPRGLARGVMSGVYRILRRILLGMKTQDPQGSLIFKSEWLRLFSKCPANDFFFSTQLVYFFESEGAAVVEVPIVMKPDFRPSRVKPIRDGWRVFKQILTFGRKHGRLKGQARHSLLTP